MPSSPNHYINPYQLPHIWRRVFLRLDMSYWLSPWPNPRGIWVDNNGIITTGIRVCEYQFGHNRKVPGYVAVCKCGYETRWILGKKGLAKKTVTATAGYVRAKRLLHIHKLVCQKRWTHLDFSYPPPNMPSPLFSPLLIPISNSQIVVYVRLTVPISSSNRLKG